MLLKILATIVYIAMIAVNYMANALPINNRSTGQISDDYPNLFAPAGLTFSIWGLIYLLLACYLAYQFIPNKKGKNKKTDDLLKKINKNFIATSFANMAWIFAWHYDFIGVSVLIMGVLLFFLIKIADTTVKAKLSASEKIFVALPFSLYFGWITIAAIANITVFLVSISWTGFGIPEQIWTILVLLIGASIGIWRMLKDENIAYGAVLLWAYTGILTKHLSESGFNGQYPGIIATVVACLLLFAFFEGRLVYAKK